MSERRGGSISFDRAAEDYDRTRALSPAAMRAVVDLLAGELAEHQPCLEIGVGTGRIALPLAATGIQMAGVDLSFPMLRRMVEKVGDARPLPIVQADATALPFGDRSFGAGLVVHVLHLVHAWRGALSELVRVVGRPGLVLVDLGGTAPRWFREVHSRFCQEAGLPTPAPRWRWTARVDRAMASLGARRRALPPIRERVSMTVEERIARYADGVDSFTWELPERARRAAADRVRAWAMRRFGSLEMPCWATWRMVYRAYDLA